MEPTAICQRVVGLDIHQAQVTACAMVTPPDGSVVIQHRQFSAFKRDRHALAELGPPSRLTKSSLQAPASTGSRPMRPWSGWLSPRWWSTPVTSAGAGSQNRHRRCPVVGDAGPGRSVAQFVRTAGALARSQARGATASKARGHAASEKNRLHKALTDAGIRLGVVVSDVHGKTARAMIEALRAGHTLTQVLALASRRFKASRAELFDALQGELIPAHGFMRNEILDHINTLETRIARFDSCLLDGLGEESNTLALLQTVPGVDRHGYECLRSR